MRQPRNETYLAAELAAVGIPSARAAAMAWQLCSLGRAYKTVSERLCGGEDVWGPYPEAGKRIERAEKRRAALRTRCEGLIRGFVRVGLVSSDGLHLAVETRLRGEYPRTESTTLL